VSTSIPEGKSWRPEFIQETVFFPPFHLQEQIEGHKDVKEAGVKRDRLS